MKKVVLAIVLASSVWAGALGFESGSVKAHTEVFGDSTIDPVTKKITSHLSMGNEIKSLDGSVSASMIDLVSDNKDRDKHMRESLETDTFGLAVFEIKEVVSKGVDSYTLKGNMTLHGTTRPLSFDATITATDAKVTIKAKGMLKMTDFAIKPIKMVFLTVRDQVDLNVELILKR
jgi:polyisoprenoid-binding protein YceI